MRYLATLLAALGIFLCLAGTIGVWYLDSQVDRARRKVFESIGEAISRIDKRLVQTQSLVAKSKITVAEIREGAQQWARDEARESLAARTNVDVKLQHLIEALHQAKHAVEISNETVLHIGQALEVVNALGFSTNVNSLAPLLTRLANVKDELTRAIDLAESNRQRLDENHDGESIADRIAQVAKIAARLAATIGNVDSRLVEFRDRLAQTGKEVSRLDAKSHRFIVAVAIGATLFLFWMLAGQLCLWRWARNR